MKKSLFLLPIAAISLSACTWVEPTKEGSRVLLVKPFNVTGCEKLGATTSTVKHRLGPLEREEETVRQELITLAKNEAAALGGDSIVAQGPEREGRMKFDIYKCDD